MNEYVHTTDPGAPGRAPQPEKERGGRGNSLTSVLFFCVSFAVLIFVLGTFPLRENRLVGTFADTVRLTALLSALRPGTAPLPGGPVSSYLTFSSREALAREAFALVEKKKSELLEVENVLEELEKERNAFAGDMDRRRDLLVEYSSVLDVAGSEEKTAFFETTLRKRVDLYHALYERKKESLKRVRERLKADIGDLAAYIAEVGKPGSPPASPDLGTFFRADAERRLLSRFFFLVERGEYARAAQTLDTLLSMGVAGANRLQAGLLRETLKLLVEYRERAAVLKRGGGLDELKMAYLREDYGKSRELAARLKERPGSDGYLLPVLSEFQGALERNERLSRETRDDMGTKESLKSLSRKALSLEKSGEREKALKIYQELLNFDLSADDRERILGKFRALVVASARQDVKRQENTKASAYLETAKLADREGREKEAVENYRKIILECPNSDYTAEVLTRLLALSKAGGV